MSIENNENLIVIDYEYAGWNPIAYDIANFINECVVDLAHPGPTGIKYYYNNFPDSTERETLCKQYSQHFFSVYFKSISENSFDEYWANSKEKF